MIHPRQSKWHLKLMSWYVNRIMKKHFHEVHFVGDLKNPDKSNLVIGNHSSWWDGFWMLYINNRIFHKKFHVMMLEQELQKRMFFSRCGAYSINPGNISVRDSLKTTMELLKNHNNMVLFYPEGIIQSATHFPKKFQKGIELVLKQLPTSSQLLYTVSLTDYFSFKKPTLCIYFMEVESGKINSVQELENSYNEFYAQCLKEQNLLAV